MHERTTGAGLKAAIAMALLSAACERDPNAVAPRHLTSFVAASSTSLIAFTSERDGNKEIYVMNADGTGQTRLTENPAADFEPTWSPDRTRLAFASNRDGNNEIYVMNADGTGQTRLTNNTAYARHPAWCGHRIAFESNQYGGFPDVYVMNDDGTGQTRLTIGNADFDESPAWSPGCDRIAYTSDPGGHRHIFVMNADGTGRIQLTNGAYAERYPAWSPDGNRIAFVSEPSDPDWQLYVMNADGSGQTSLTDKVGYNGYPAWSPDGFQIAFPTNRDGNYEIYLDVWGWRDGHGPEPLAQLHGGRHLHGHLDRDGQSGGDEFVHALRQGDGDGAQPAAGGELHVELHRPDVHLHEHEQ